MRGRAGAQGAGLMAALDRTPLRPQRCSFIPSLLVRLRQLPKPPFTAETQPDTALSVPDGSTQGAAPAPLPGASCHVTAHWGSGEGPRD